MKGGSRTVRIWPGVRDLVCLDWTADVMIAHRPPLPGAMKSPCGAGPWAAGNHVMAYRAELARAPLCAVCWDTTSTKEAVDDRRIGR